MTMLAAQSPGGASRFHFYDLVRWLVGAVLLTAAGMDGYELATGPVAEKGLLTSRWFLIAVVEFELALGLCLVAGVWKRRTWWVAVVSFAVFACITTHSTAGRLDENHEWFVQTPLEIPLINGVVRSGKSGEDGSLGFSGLIVAAD